MENYTFFETLGSTESEKNNVYIFSKHPMAAILDFQYGDCFLLKSGNISASNHPRHMILVSKHTFLIENSGIDDVWNGGDVHGSATTRQFPKCTHYNRSLHAHIYSYMALYVLVIE